MMIKSILLSTALVFSLGFVNAQTIPNADFENWTNAGSYENPDGWGTFNPATSIMSVYTATKGTPGSSGASYLKLTSKMVATTVVNGMAVSGTINTSTMSFAGFPMTGRPTSLNGKWQHMIYGNSQGMISVTLSRWDAGTSTQVIVGGGNVDLTGMAMSWANFSIPIHYIEGSNPDTCLIIMQASGDTPAVNDYLWVDNLAFSGSSTGLQHVANSLGDVKAYPNPANETLHIALSLAETQSVKMEILDLAGKVVAAKDCGSLSGVSTQTLEMTALGKGIYFVKVSTTDATEIRKIAVQ